MLFSDDLVLLATSEDDLQHYSYNLNVQLNATWKYQQKRHIIAFQEKEPVPSKTYADKRTLIRAKKSLILVICCHIKER
jgi:hypothetical protein